MDPYEKNKSSAKERERLHITIDQRNALVYYYNKDPTPGKKTLAKIAEDIGLSRRKVTRWFQNMRYKSRGATKRQLSHEVQLPTPLRQNNNPHEIQEMNPEHVIMCLELALIIDISRMQRTVIDPE